MGRTSKTCPICSKTLSCTSSLKTHLFEVHKNDEIYLSTYDFDKYHSKCLEDNCKTSYRSISDLREHLQTAHAMKIERDDLHFANTDEFKLWFDKVCEDNKCKYIRKNLIDQETKRTYFYCNRSGKDHGKVNNRKRSLKRQGSCKIGSNCISQIILINQEPNSIDVIYYKTHYGHNMDLEHVFLSKHTRNDIAQRLASGQSVIDIFNLYRQSASKDKMARSDMITRKDINNIKKALALEEEQTLQDEALLQEIVQNEDTESSDKETISNFDQEGNTIQDLYLDRRQKLQDEINRLKVNIDSCGNSYFDLISSQVLEGLKYVNSFFLNEETNQMPSDNVLGKQTDSQQFQESEVGQTRLRLNISNEHDYSGVDV